MDIDGATQRRRIEARKNRALASEIELHESQTRLRESFGFGTGFGDVVNPMSQFYDGPMPIFPLYPSRFDRRIGSNGIWISEAQMDLIRLYARYLYDTSPTAKGILRGKANYVFGSGFRYTIQAKPHEKLSEALQQQAQRILDDTLEANDWYQRERERFIRANRDGESILRITPDDDEDCCARIRTVEPEQVRAPYPSPEWLMGVHTEIDDRERVLGYGVTYTGTLDDMIEVPAEEISFLKLNTDLAVLRGLTSFYTTQELLSSLQKLLRATIEGESVRESIAYMVEYALADESTVKDNSALNNFDYDTLVPTGHSPRKVPTERVVSGSVHEMPASRVVKPPPIADTSNATNALAAGYQALSVAFQVPQWMVSGDTGNTNFAASLTAESPMVKDTLCEQELYSRTNIRLFKKILKIAEDQGRLPEGTVRKIEIYAECPSPAVRDAQQETNQNSVLHQAGILSKKTWSEREDLDFEQEAANFEDEGGTPQEQQAETDVALVKAKSTEPGAVYKQETSK